MTQNICAICVICVRIKEVTVFGSQYVYLSPLSCGSLMETYNQLLIAIDLTYITEESVEAIKPSIDAVAKMINALHNKYAQQLNEG